MKKQSIARKMYRFWGLRSFLCIFFSMIFIGFCLYIIRMGKVWNNPKDYLVVLIAFGFVFVLIIMQGIILWKERRIYQCMMFNAESREHAFVHVEQLNQNLRAQRHDFLNHIQVLYSLMELEEYEEIKIYLNHLYGDVVKVGGRIKTESVSLNALLQAKANEAEGKGIQLQVLAKAHLSQIKIGDWELCRILGNLIDNGMDALMESDQETKIITVQIYEAIKSIEICVRNNGPRISEAFQSKIFEAGFSSKGKKEERGMGLYIVKEILRKQGHSITLKQEGDVCFQISLKKDD